MQSLVDCTEGAHLVYRLAALGELGRLLRFCRLKTAARPTMRPARTSAMLQRAQRSGRQGCALARTSMLRRLHACPSG